VRILDETGPTPDSVVAEHVALPDSRPTDRAFVRLNMITSVDGGTVVAGVSGGLGNRDDHAVFAALRANADIVLVGLGTVIAEGYGVPDPPHLQLHVVSDTTDTSGAAELFASGRATLVLPTSAGPVPAPRSPASSPPPASSTSSSSPSRRASSPATPRASRTDRRPVRSCGSWNTASSTTTGSCSCATAGSEDHDPLMLAGMRVPRSGFVFG
jgi:hypothetical protein